jgi:hypothetical protein
MEVCSSTEMSAVSKLTGFETAPQWAPIADAGRSEPLAANSALDIWRFSARIYAAGY